MRDVTHFGQALLPTNVPTASTRTLQVWMFFVAVKGFTPIPHLLAVYFRCLFRIFRSFYLDTDL